MTIKVAIISRSEHFAELYSSALVYLAGMPEDEIVTVLCNQGCNQDSLQMLSSSGTEGLAAIIMQGELPEIAAVKEAFPRPAIIYVSAAGKSTGQVRSYGADYCIPATHSVDDVLGIVKDEICARSG